MPTYEITSPSGKVFEVSAPEGATEQDALEYVMRNLGKPKADAPNPATDFGGLPLRPFGIDTGITMPESVSNFAAGVGMGLTNLARGVGQKTGLVPTHEIIAASERDKALTDTGAGMTGNIAGTVAGLLPAAFIPGANTLAGSAAIGTVTGLLAPVADENVVGGTLKNAAVGGILGPAAIMGGRAINAGLGAVKGLVAPFTNAGQAGIAGRTLRGFATNADDAARAAESAVAPIPGYRQTLAEATQDPGLANLQRAVANLPDSQGQIGLLQSQNAVTLKNAINSIAGDEGAISAAKSARTAASNPLYSAARGSTALADPARTINLIDRIVSANPANKALVGPLKEIRETLFEQYPTAQRGSDAWKAINDVIQRPRYASSKGSVAVKEARTIMDRVRKGAIDADEAIDQLNGIKGINSKNQTFVDVVDLAKKYMRTPEYVLRQKPRELMSALDNIDAMLGKADNAFVRRELTTIKKSLSRQVSKATPEYGQAERTFAQMSQPINQMQIGGLLGNKLSPALDDFAQTGGLRGAQYAEALRNEGNLVRQATGMKRKTLVDIMTPGQMDTIQGVGKALAGKVASENAGRAVGSNTAQNLASQNLIRQIAGPLGLPQSFLESQFLPTLMRPVNFALKSQEPAITGKLTEAMIDPKVAAQLMKAGVPRELWGKVIENASRYGAMPGLLSVNSAQK